jgi:hypothetical protein
MKKTFSGTKKHGNKRFETVTFKRAVRKHARDNVAQVGAPKLKPQASRYFKPKKDTYTAPKY